MIYISDGTFHLTDGKHYSYVFYVSGGRLYHSYYGKALAVTESRTAASLVSRPSRVSGNDCALFEYSEEGRGDFRVPSISVRGKGFASTEFLYSSHRLLKQKPSIGMPALRGKAETLEVTLKDAVAKLTLKLYYTVYDGALARHAEIINDGDAVSLVSADSMCVELGRGEYDHISLDGRWGHECGVSRNRVASGIHTLSSTRGLTSHQHNPFVAVAAHDATEDSGEVYGFNLIYSGNFRISLESDEKSQLRVNAGIHLMGGIELGRGESFVTPEAVTVYSDSGIGEMSRIFHRLYRAHLISPRFADKPRPIVANSWESMYFDFDRAKLERFVEASAGLGIDTVVLDDGWFGKRDDDTSGLGDWTVNTQKIDGGLDAVIECCKRNGLKFGLWFEPEAISPDSDLYRAHPEWAIATDGRKGMEMRNQYMLDFSRTEVVDHIFGAMKQILASHDISYVKWDANRHISDLVDVKKYIGCVKGMYDLYERLTAAFPNILIEGCASGGGRFDPAMLYYSPMIWASDDTDAYERTEIQYGLSLCYPLQTLSNHVSVCPNHQTGRVTPFDTRGAVASLGCLGYELDLAKVSAEEREKIKRQIAAYRNDAALILTGELYRLKSPFDGGMFCEEIVAQDGSAAYVVFVRGLNDPNLPLAKVRLKGLDPTALYTVEERGLTASGSELMYCGLEPNCYCADFVSEVLHVTKVK